MVRLLALFSEIDDLEAFERTYERDHLPLAAAMPGLLGIRHHQVTPVEGLVIPFAAELLFADRATLEASLQSVEGRRAGRSLKALPASGITLLIIEGGFDR